MAIITISRGCFSHGKEIAEKVAARLDYKCISREVLVEASQMFKIPEKTLLKSLHDAPTVLEKITGGREKYLDYIRVALLEYIRQDNIIYHGHAGHLLVPEIPHLIKVRIIAAMDTRIDYLRQSRNISRKEALAFLTNEDNGRRRWTSYLYKVDIEDPSLYDIILNIGKDLSVENACDIICRSAQRDTYKTTSANRTAVHDIAIQNHAVAALQGICDARVTSEDGVVHIWARPRQIRRTSYTSPKLQGQIEQTIQIDLHNEIIKIVEKLPGVKEVTCDVEMPFHH